MAQPPPQLTDAVTTAIDTLMALEQRMRLGHPSQHAHDEHEADVARICADLRAGARGRGDRPVDPPIARTRSGAW